MSETYRSGDGHTMRRERGTSPNGNEFGNRWVLRDPSGAYLGHDQYRYDLAPRFGFDIEGVALKARATPPQGDSHDR